MFTKIVDYKIVENSSSSKKDSYSKNARNKEIVFSKTAIPVGNQLASFIFGIILTHLIFINRGYWKDNFL